MLTRLLSLFGCRHARLTFPLTLPGKRGTYTVCTSCGKEFAYDWQAMRITTEAPAAVGAEVEA